MKIKPGIAWFPVPIRWSNDMTTLSDGAFRLLVYLCLNANRETAQISFSQTRLAQILGKSRRSLAVYLKELQESQICVVRTSSNQYTGGTIQIQEPYWPYEEHSSTALQNPEETYLEAIKSYVQHRSCVRCRFSELDREMVQQWFRNGLKLQTVERAILIACGRKYVSWLNGGDSNPIGSLRYFEQTLKEVLQDKPPSEYWDYLAIHVKRLEQKWLSAQSFACETFSQAKKR